MPPGDGRLGGAVEAEWEGTGTGVSIIAIPDFSHVDPVALLPDWTTEGGGPHLSAD